VTNIIGAETASIETPILFACSPIVNHENVLMKGWACVEEKINNENTVAMRWIVDARSGASHADFLGTRKLTRHERSGRNNTAIVNRTSVASGVE